MMQKKIPREVRDMIYAQLWDKPRMKRTYSGLTTTLDAAGHANGCAFGILDECGHHQNQPHWMKTTYMGSTVAKEVVEAWYSFLPELGRYPGSTLSSMYNCVDCAY
jgi:hypothetical protein